MSGCHGVTDEGVEAVLQFCPYISIFIFKEIHINGCHGVTDEGVEAVLQFCPHISIFIF